MRAKIRKVSVEDAKFCVCTIEYIIVSLMANAVSVADAVSGFDGLRPFQCLTSLRASPFTFLWLTPFEGL